MSALAQEQDDIYLRIDHCQAEVYRHQNELLRLDSELKDIEARLNEFADERQKYELLTTLSENLEKLADIGANSLFWGGLLEDSQVDGQLKQLRDKASFFQRRIKKVMESRDRIVARINQENTAVGYLLEEIEELRELEEESKNGYVIEREIPPLPSRTIIMPWTKKGEDEKKYRKILLLSLLISIFLGLAIPQWRLSIPDRLEVPLY